MTSFAHDLAPFGRSDGASVEWAVSRHLVPYSTAVAAMEARVEAILSGQAAELVWLLEHPPLYTAGVSAKAQDLLDPDRFPVFHSGRGGQFTYHGPGQRVVYLMLDLRSRRRDARAFVRALEAWIIAGLADLGVPAETRQGRVGVWVDEPHEAKIAAIGVKLRRWVSFHGVSLNVSPDLSHFTGIVPCGLSGFAVTSLEQLGKSSDMGAADRALAEAFVSIFGPVNFSDSAPAP